MNTAFWSATKLLAALRAKKISALELFDLYAARVRQHNRVLNAICVMDLDADRKAARAADRAKGKKGPLHGLPMTVKESFDVAGWPTTRGLTEFKDNIAKQDALAVERLKRAGAIVFGKTNVPVLLADWQTFNPLYGTTNNPWDLLRTPGGSSGGSAAALAAGLTGLELGSDIGASIRNPAHYCGVYGHKPTWGICSPKGHSLPGGVHPGDIAVIGPLARRSIAPATLPSTSAVGCEGITATRSLRNDESFGLCSESFQPAPSTSSGPAIRSSARARSSALSPPCCPPTRCCGRPRTPCPTNATASPPTASCRWRWRCRKPKRRSPRC